MKKNRERKKKTYRESRIQTNQNIPVMREREREKTDPVMWIRPKYQNFKNLFSNKNFNAP